jgi:hypothetical protein
MEEQSPLTGNDLVRARLDGLAARTGGTPADFEEAVKQLAPDIQGAIVDMSRDSQTAAAQGPRAVGGWLR